MFTEMPRKYELKRRAGRKEETRRRIVDATVALHEEVGPARTSISAIAERAGVERLTVYRHFPDDASLFAACSHRFTERHTPPDPEAWAAIADPVARLRTALTAFSAFYRDGEAMLTNIERDAPQLPILRDVLAARVPYLSRVREVLLAGWQTTDEDRPLLLAALDHALDFQTWRSIVRRNSVSEEQAQELMIRLVVGAAGVPHREGGSPQ
jgi:AcrR family transcriptional regulator